MQNICFFDIETRNLFQDLDPNYNARSFNDKKIVQKTLTPKLGLATASVFADGSKPQWFSFDEGQENELIDALDDFDVIVGHNVVNFDFPVLSPYFQGDIIQHFLPKIKDTFEDLKRSSNGSFIGLDDLAKLNLGLQKNIDPKTAPKLWKNGQKDVVREYCKNDVQMLKSIYYLGKERGKLKYTIKEYGVTKGIGEVKVSW